MTSRPSTSLPVVGSDSWVQLSNVGPGHILIHCRVSLARSARCPIRPQSDPSLPDDTNIYRRTKILDLAHQNASFGLSKVIFLLHKKKCKASNGLLLIVCGHDSHVTIYFIRYCDNKILSYTFSLHQVQTLHSIEANAWLTIESPIRIVTVGTSSKESQGPLSTPLYLCLSIAPIIYAGQQKGGTSCQLMEKVTGNHASTRGEVPAELLFGHWVRFKSQRFAMSYLNAWRYRRCIESAKKSWKKM